ncbi:MAG: deoxyribonucleoside regulator, partial [Deltaproteobacteria bacterium]|nr:deoxyribonucleoside regulator [Deltaproteobacteria bacterium]
ALQDQKKFAARASWYYYKIGMTQGEIANRLGINRARVINILNEARKDGTVTFHVSGEDEELMALEVQLKEKWGLRDVFLTPGVFDEELKNDLSMAGAQYLEMNLPSKESLIALGWGETISGITRNLGRVIPERTSFVTLCGGVMHYLSEHTPANVGTPLSGFLYPFHVIPTPLMVGSPELRDQLLNEPEVQHVMNMAQLADIAMVGIGSLKTSTEFEGFGYKSQKELDLLKKRGAVGEMHGEYFNADGEPLEMEHHHRLISIRLETLRKMKHVVGVAGGPDKIEALKAALKGGFIHSLITDEVTARALISSS